MTMKEQRSIAMMIIPALIVLFSGTYSAVTGKVIYSVKADGLSKYPIHTFTKPYFMTLMMFVGEALCLIYYYASVWWKGTASSDLQPLLNPSGEETGPTPTAVIANGSGSVNGSGKSYGAAESPSTAPMQKPPLWFYAVLSCFDLCASTLNGVGLRYVAASVNQMMRGSMILFTGVFTVLVLQKRLHWKQWGGIGIVCMGLVLVGASSVLRPGGGSTTATAAQGLLGTILILLGSALNSLQNVFEEKLLKGMGAAEVDPNEVVGWEGIFGSIFSAFIMLPIVQHITVKGSTADVGGVVENSLDTWDMLKNSPKILLLLLGYSVALALMNGFSQVISKYMSAVIRMLVNTCRVVLVWMVDLIIFYGISGGQPYGEDWDRYSWVELGGFALLITGTIIYVSAHEATKKLNERDETFSPAREAPQILADRDP
jgi:drug/metabolite transporter (DMT)-like permease